MTALLRNYRLKDSLEAALALSEAAAEGARAHAKAAVENLSIIIEYFPPEPDGPIKGRVLRPEELQFSVRALAAAEKELNSFLAALPAQIVEELAREVSSA